MSNQVPTTQATKAGIFRTSIKEELKQAIRTGASQDVRNEFLSEIARALQLGAEVGEDMPAIEAPREIIEHYNPISLRQFDEVGYFVFNNVRVYEEGKREEAIKREKMSPEERNMRKG